VSGQQRRVALPGVDELFRTTGPRPVPPSVVTPESVIEDRPVESRPVAPESTDAGELVAWLAGLIDAKQVVDVGSPDRTFGLSLTKGMPIGGTMTLVTDDGAGLAQTRKILEDRAPEHRVRTIPGDPRDVLGRLSDAGYDLVILRDDASSDRVIREQAVRLLRPGGILLLVGEPGRPAPSREVAEDPRLAVASVPYDPSVTLARVRMPT
jgi:predicted O-methyltransferase YrrM